jgi:hypothetical protein
MANANPMAIVDASQELGVNSVTNVFLASMNSARLAARIAVVKWPAPSTIRQTAHQTAEVVHAKKWVVFLK